jgi:hypothetical protein
MPYVPSADEVVYSMALGSYDGKAQKWPASLEVGIRSQKAIQSQGVVTGGILCE